MRVGMKLSALGPSLLAGLAAATLAVPAPALASGFALKEQSASGQGASFAGITAGANGDASAMFYNPATLGILEGNQSVGVLSGIFPESRVEGASATRASRLGGAPISGNASPGDIGRDAPVAAGYGSYAVTPDLTLGVSLTAPWGLATVYPKDWIGRYHARHSSLLTVNLQPTAAYKLSPSLTLGAGVQMQYARARLTQFVDFGGILGAPGTRDGYGDIRGDDFGFGATAGVLYEPMRGTRFGLSFRSAVHHELKGKGSFSNVPAPLAASFATSDVTAKLVTPEILSFGAYHEIDSRWAVMGDLQWTNWSRYRESRVDYANPLRPDTVTEQQFHDTWFASVGAAYKWSDGLTLRAGIGYDEGAAPDEHRGPRLPDTDRYWLSAGVGFSLFDHVRTDVGYSLVLGRKARINLTDDLTGPEAFRGNLSASYDAHVHVIAIQNKLSF